MHPLGFTLAADPRDNQDALALDEQDGIAVVVDGAGLPRDPEAGCRHPVSWYSRALAERYRDLLRDRALPMDGALALAITQVRALHPECRLDHTAPSATVAAFREADDLVEHLVLCDASIVLAFADGTVVEVTDDRLDRVVGPAQAVLRIRPSGWCDVWRQCTGPAMSQVAGGVASTTRPPPSRP